MSMINKISTHIHPPFINATLITLAIFAVRRFRRADSHQRSFIVDIEQGTRQNQLSRIVYYLVEVAVFNRYPILTLKRTIFTNSLFKIFDIRILIPKTSQFQYRCSQRDISGSISII